MNKCTINGCERKHLARGYCRLHYERSRKGLPLEASSKIADRPAIIEYGLAKIPLGVDARDGYAVVDEEYAWLDKYKWFLNKGYAVRNSEYKRGEKRHTIRMHRYIIDTPDGLDTDHINGNKLDNRVVNLRPATRAENQWNRKKQSGSSKYKGVTKQGNGWKAQLRCNKEFIYLGYYDSEEAASKAYSEATKKYHGDFAFVDNSANVADNLN